MLPKKSKSIAPRANVKPGVMNKFLHSFNDTMDHFKASVPERQKALEVAMTDFAHANECYLAIARSL